MEHLDFVLWMVGYPMSVTLGNAVRQHQGKNEVKFQQLTDFLIWVGIGFLLW